MRTKAEIIEVLESVDFEFQFEFLARILDKEGLNLLCDWIEKYKMNLSAFKRYNMEYGINLKYRSELKHDNPNYLSPNEDNCGCFYADDDDSEETKKLSIMSIEYDKFAREFPDID